jgi:chaperone modulatory protein CbpM
MSAQRPPSSPPPSPSQPQSPWQAPSAEPGPARRVRVRYPRARPPELSLNSFSRLAGLHPDMTRRFVALGLLRASRDAAGNLWFEPTQLPEVARIQRLRAGLSLNYAAIGLVIDLLDRIDRLEAELGRSGGGGFAARGGRTRVRPWVRPRGKE